MRRAGAAARQCSPAGSSKDFSKNGSAAFQSPARDSRPTRQERIEYLEKKIRRQDEVLAELIGEDIALKQGLAEL